MENQFNALVVDKKEEDTLVEVKSITYDQLPEGNVTIKTAYSSVNYKDGLATIPNGNIVSRYPFIPGIDLAGIVISSNDSRFKKGDQVIATSYEIGVNHFGGFSEIVRLNADWVVPLPESLSLKEAMAYGTAGFTAALSIQKLQENNITPENGSILVTGSTGGVGSLSVAMLSKLGYEVVASTGKADEHSYLKELGATQIVSREEINPEKVRPLGKQLWAGAIDPVGGKTLASVLSNIKYGGAVAVSGLTGGVKVPTTVFPFILRGVNLLGIDSAFYPMSKRILLWNKMANELKPDNLLTSIGQEIQFQDLPDTLNEILEGKVKGRTIVKYDS